MWLVDLFWWMVWIVDGVFAFSDFWLWLWAWW